MDSLQRQLEEFRAELNWHREASAQRKIHEVQAAGSEPKLKMDCVSHGDRPQLVEMVATQTRTSRTQVGAVSSSS
eukprot:2171409-Alexandrium_andersonii.AAC.1